MPKPPKPLTDHLGDEPLELEQASIDSFPRETVEDGSSIPQTPTEQYLNAIEIAKETSENEAKSLTAKRVEDAKTKIGKASNNKIEIEKNDLKNKTLS